MPFKPFEVTTPHVAYTALGGFVVLFGMFSLFIREKLYIGEAPLAFLFGVIIGPYGANIFNPRSFGDEATSNIITLEVTRVILAVGVFAIGVELPKAYMAKHWKSLFYLLGPVMTWGWFVSAGLIYALIPGLSFLSSLAVAACLTPTDPILAAAVVGGKYAVKHVPVHIRHLLAAESGCNDGAAFPFLYIALYLVTQASDKHAVQDWFLITWLYEVALGIVLGSVIGFAFRHLMKFCERKDLIDRQSYVAQYVSLAMFTMGVLTLLGSDDLLAAFSCGAAFAWDGFFNRQTEQSVFSSVIDLLFNIAAFVYIGAWMPFNAFHNEELTLSVWRLIVIAILVLLLRRLPVMLALYRWIPDVKTFREAVFSGHFGPMGVGAVFISVLASEKLPHPESPTEDQAEMLAATIQPIVSFMVLTSITIHGLSIPFFSLGRRVHSVSRTWSRHQSMNGAGPDWALHTRKISGPEDIVINRDPLNVIERGELAPSEKTGTRTPLSAEGTDKSPLNSTPGTGATTPIDRKFGSDRGDLDALTSGRPDTPPDGTDLITEWKEGSKIVVEKRNGPGDEVTVEVIHAEGPDKGKVYKSLKGPAEEVENSLKHPSERLTIEMHKRKEEVEDGLQSAKNVLEGGVRALANGSLERAIDVSTAPSSPESRLREEAKGRGSTNQDESAVADDDDESWTSEEEESQDGNSGHHSLPSRVNKGKHGSKTHAPTHPHHFTQRRRNSMRRGVLARPLSAGLTHLDHEDEGERGRTATTSTTGNTPTSPLNGHADIYLGNGDSTPKLRVASLRAPARSHSPAYSMRSIRFADDQASSLSRPASSSGKMTDRDNSSGDGNKVTFDLS